MLTILFIFFTVQASIGANTWVVNGSPQTKTDNLDNLRKLAEQFQKQAAGECEGAAAAIAQEADNEVPELVAGETFETAAEEGQKS
ncbi:putative transcription factor BTF3 [Helianthus annuus]|nr:putative transcription factor BTF3 [Helianthus annuus]